MHTNIPKVLSKQMRTQIQGEKENSCVLRLRLKAENVNADTSHV